MHLKSLTLKGFKSFASATALRFEPGVTCVVGPNGSGKSNVVDAIAWVLGEQGAKALRGGKMEDVIFAGTAGRPPLGRAEVTLTIDNSDGALPIDYSEVSLTRRMFRSGESEYEINGDACRLLDIQELLSDSGIGREMHVIVGQGQLDSVLSARPEDRRGFIEEAAGVLKHRKRKDKALRKLDAMQANVTRLTDLVAELRRQLKPLGRQAEAARRAATVQADLRDARLRLLADDLVQLRQALSKDVADEASARQRRAAAEAGLGRLRGREAELEKGLADDAPALAAAQDTWYKLSALAERFRGLVQLADERSRFLSAPPDDHRTGRNPEELELEAAEIRAQEEDLVDALAGDQQRLDEAVARRSEAERKASAAEQALVAAVRAVADRREGLARLSGQVEALRSRAAAADDEIARLSAGLADARERAEDAAIVVAETEAVAEECGEREAETEAVHASAVAAHDEAKARVRVLADAERAAERDASEWRARAEALAVGLNRKDGTGTVLAAGRRIAGLRGSVAALLTVAPGYSAALAAALGPYADAVVVDTPDAAADAILLLKSEDGGRASLLIAAEDRGDGGPAAEVPPGLPVRSLSGLIDGPAAVLAVVRSLLRDVVVADDLAAARAVVAGHPQLVVATVDGDLLGSGRAGGGSAGTARSVIEVQAAVDEAVERRRLAEMRCGRLTVELGAARAELAARAEAVATAQRAHRDAETGRHALARKLAEASAASRSAVAEAQRLETSRTRAEQARASDLAGLSALTERLAAAQSLPLDDEPSTAERDSFTREAAAARQNEMEVRLAVRTGEERVRALHGRAESLDRAARTEREARARAEAMRQSRARGAQVTAAVAAGARAALAATAASLTAAETERDAAAIRKAQREGELLEVRARGKDLAEELARLTDAVHADELARAEQRLRIEQLEARAADDFGIAVETLLAEYGPDQPVPPTAAQVASAEAEGVPPPPSARYDRALAERRAARAERDLSALGKVNPLALEEFAALEERHAFLSTQLEDLKATRRDLLTVVRDVDDRIVQVFADAFADTAREFEVVFRTLFPGGEGRLLLTDPSDLLTTGVEVEARPPGKKVKRLSLLSGGERSLTAVAMLVAIFRARPSPFYVLDEVEAALDDTNLGRLLTLIAQLRGSSQLIVITHQKRTMEIADALYGVTMRGDGITQVISQRLRKADVEAV